MEKVKEAIAIGKHIKEAHDYAKFSVLNDSDNGSSNLDS